MTGPVGFSISGGLSPREIVDLAVLAESLGYESFWLAEGHGGDHFALLSACAMANAADSPRHQHHQRVRTQLTDHRNGGSHRGRTIERSFRVGPRLEPPRSSAT